LQKDFTAELQLLKADIDEQKAGLDAKRMTLHQVPAETEVSERVINKVKNKLR
jgi:hypothetical protein